MRLNRISGHKMVGLWPLRIATPSTCVLFEYRADCLKRYLRKAGEEENWRENANYVEQWKQIRKVAVQRSDK